MSITDIRDKLDAARQEDPTKWSPADLLSKARDLVINETRNGKTCKVIVLVVIDQKDVKDEPDIYVAQRGHASDVEVIGWLEVFKTEAVEMLGADLE
jgi:hypothetical protein